MDQRRGSRAGKILVVDDEDVVRRMLARLLGEDHEVTGVACGQAAQDLLGEGARYDVIFCDLVMPGLSGIELHDWLARHAPDQARRMVFISGDFDARAEAFLEQTGNGRLTKPFLRADVLALVSRALG